MEALANSRSRSRRFSLLVTWTRPGSAAVVAIAAVFLGVTSTLALRLNVWQDEAYSLHTSSLGFWEALRQGVTYEAQAPLYFGLLSVWQSLNGSLFFARALSIVFTLVSLYVAWCFARRYISAIAPGAILAAIAFNPFMIWAAVEVRPYAAAIALSTVLLYLLFRGWIDDRVSKRARIAFIAVAIVSTYTQYYIATLVPAAMLCVVTLRQPGRARTFAVAACCIGLALVPIALILPIQLNSYQALNSVSSLPAYAIVLAVFEYLYPHAWIGSWIHAPLKNTLYFALALAPFLLAWRFFNHLTRTARVLLIVVATICALFGILIGVAHVPVLFPRHTAVLFIPVLLAAFAVFESVVASRRTVVIATFSMVYACFTILSLWSTYHHFSKNGDWQRVGSFLSKNATDGDAVAVFDAEAVLPLRTYFKALPLRAIPRPLSFRRFDEADFVLHNEHEVAARISNAAKRDRRIWLVINDVCTTRPVFYGCSYLSKYIKGNFNVVRVTKFDGSSVSELSSKIAP